MALNEMLTKNLLWAEWISYSAFVTLIGILVIFYSHLVPEPIKRIFKYGKAAGAHANVKKLHRLEVPKRWFYHFYLFATIFYASLAFSVCRVYFWGEEPLFSTKLLLDGIVGNHRHASGKYSLSTKVSTHLSSMPFAVTPESVIVVMLMMVAQVNRRLYECRKLSVYSDAKMNVVHYFFGHSFYFGVGMSVIAEAPGFTGSSVSSDIAMSSGFLKWNHVLGVLIFVVASILQNQSHSILANLRKDKKGNVVTLEHTIPRGGLFTFVSCPHYFAEILIYLSMCLVFAGQSMTWCMVCLFVVSNQIIVGLFNHYWYHQTFKDYPKSRKAVIPFIL